MTDKLEIINKNKWSFILINNLIFILFWFIILNIITTDILNFSISFVTLYLLYLFLCSIFILKLRDKYFFLLLSTIFLLIFSGFDFYNKLIISNIPLPVFSYPDIIADFYFYIYFPILASFLSNLISKKLRNRK